MNKHLTKKPIVVASGASVVTLIGGGLAVGGQAVTAADYTATDQSTLANAIDAANANSGADTITIAPGTITLTEALPVIEDELTIIGAGEGVTVLDGAGAHRIFRATGATALTISDMTLQNGFTEFYGGGAVLAEQTSLTLESVTMSNSYTRFDGGAVEVRNDTFPPERTLDISDSTFDSNSAVQTAAVAANGFISSVTISNSTFTSNTSSNGLFGTGALTIACTYFCNVTLSDSVFAYNSTENGGVGAAYIYAGYGGSVTIEGSTFRTNTVMGSRGVGALLVSYTSEVTVDESYFADNATSGNTYGGALTLLSSASAAVTKSTFTGNSTAGSGGALWSSSAYELNIADSTFAYNEAAFAGGLYVYAADSVTISNTTFNSNSANYRGGAINARADTVVVDQSTLSGNSGGDAGAMRLYATQAVIRNSTITTNTSGSGGAVRVDKSQGALEIVNTVISANTAGADENNDLLATNLSSTQILYSLIGVESTSGSKTINGLITSTDPGLGPLGDNGGNTATMVPLAGSPLIDAGTPLSPPSSPPLSPPSFATDQRGAPRIVDVIDIGAVEVQPPPETTVPETTTPETTTPETTTPETTTPETTTPGTTAPGTTDPVGAILPPTGGSGRTGVTAALLTALGAALTLGASRRGKLRS